MPRRFYAHSLPGRPVDQWQPLEEHLKKVAKLAAEFARPFGGDEWAYLAGLWHDLGKYSDAFQAKLLAENGIETHLGKRPGRVVHSEAGGHLASLKGWKGADRVLSWLIMGHHTGLTDYFSDEIGAKALEPKMRNAKQSEHILKNVPFEIAGRSMPCQSIPSGADPAFFLRMLFSCIVDADFLDTEAFMNKNKAQLRNQDYPPLKSLLPAFDYYINQICARVRPTSVNKIRAQILEQCRKMATKNLDVFSLTAPTGGGKTLSSLAFALRHAAKYEKSRIIYVIPYTSIIEQTANVFRKIPGFENAVVEHHCNVVEPDEREETSRNRLAAENWNAPIIVTTSVQFFESVYACKPSRCRKLHNIANSVVIFDEAQCLPPKYLRSAVFAIRELYRHYSVTPLLCTATQPVLTQTEQFDFSFSEGFQSVMEIVEDPDGLANELRRVKIELCPRGLDPVSHDELAGSIIAEGLPVLCIVNRKDDARHLARLLPEGQTVHLSTNMCAEHRSKTLDVVRKQLEQENGSFFVISTSLVEAGVDIDFPVVYRALAGLDSIAQAAGRCNREGRQASGKTVVFVPEKQPDYVLQPASITRELLSTGSLSSLLTPANYRDYFRQRFWQLGEQVLDEKNILQLLSGHMNYYFSTAARKFQLIEEDWQKVVIAPYGRALELVARLLKEPWHERKILRRLQYYAVNIPGQLFDFLLNRDFIRELENYQGIFLLDVSLYDDRYGFLPPDEADGIDPEKFMV
ncbi:MAG: CRISPR-associated helicase Cas3' [Deltaproteobacteria bacterium]|nr:CRISPR-associated helicase Cas3' [Deltaproteobacteria bacterium]